MLMNWPPSRGPQPEWLAKGPEIIVPETTMKRFQRVARAPEPEQELVEDLEDPNPAASELPRKISFADLRREMEEQFKWNIRLMYHIETVASLELSVVEKLLYGIDEDGHYQKTLPTRTYGVIIGYPLSVDVALTIPPLTIKSRRTGKERQEQNVPYLLWTIARAYAHIYEHWEDHGVWGHALNDLWFEQLRINGEELSIGIGS